MSRLGFDVHGQPVTDEACNSCADFKRCLLMPYITRPCQKQARQGTARPGVEAALREKALTPDSPHTEAVRIPLLGYIYMVKLPTSEYGPRGTEWTVIELQLAMQLVLARRNDMRQVISFEAKRFWEVFTEVVAPFRPQTSDDIDVAVATEVAEAYRSGSNQVEDPFPAPPGYSWKPYIYSRGPNDPPGNSRVLTCDGCGEAHRTTEPQPHKALCPNVPIPPDPVHPPHYKRHPAGIECIDVIEHMPFNLGTAVKYLWRAGQKPGETVETDLRKAIWYIEREIKRLGGHTRER